MPSPQPRPLLTLKVHSALQAAARDGVATVTCSLDLDRSTDTVEIGASAWTWQGHSFPYLERCKDRTIYYWTGTAFEPAARFTTSLIKLVPTDWGPPTFEIDGIKMLPTAHVSPYADAQRKVALVHPRDKSDPGYLRRARLFRLRVVSPEARGKWPLTRRARMSCGCAH